MEHIKEIIEIEESEELSWKDYAIKQGYLVKFNRGLLKAPKMQYFVLTDIGLISFESKPKHDTKPLCFLPYKQLSSIKLDHIELNSCKLCCMQLTSKTSPSFTLAFKCKEDRDDWMMIMMKAFSEALLTTSVFDKSSEIIDKNNASQSDDSTTKEKPERNVSTPMKKKLQQKLSTGSYGPSLRRKRRKGDKGSIRRSKSYDSLALHDVTNTAFTFPMKLLTAEPAKPETENAFQPQQSRKRKSEPDIHVTAHSPSAKTTDSKEKLFANSCSFEHRDSLTVEAEKQLKSKNDAKHKTNRFAKLLSMFENPALLSAH
ncbi:Hypothetical predicted protein [Paramuricea clavata]|uniref:Uncharacterized protein n=1 Tax=Paramuricea clavata TaxID=317549 RepID=A0A7D9I453_PARCT|nr:Hypothetical predicted protein [Paramuricea clavata]